MTDTQPRTPDDLPEYRWEEIPADTPPAILDALGGPQANRVVGAEPVRVLRGGGRWAWQGRGKLVLEDGAELAIDGSLPPDLPLGYHDFQADDGGKTRIIIAPGQCVAPAEPCWGWTVQLHSLRSRASWGLGDLADLARLAHWSAALGAGMLMVNPLGAQSPGVPQGASPYYPTSRRFRNPLYLRVEDVPGAPRLGPELERLAAEGHALGAERRLDRDRVFFLKDAALRAIWSATTPDAAFEDYQRWEGPSLARFATFCVLAVQFGDDWRRWPAEYRRPENAAVARLAEERAGEVRYHQWLQWLLDEQLAKASAKVPILQDLPIGMSPGGADAWEWQDMLAGEMSIGAPPDAFNGEGQDWQLPPLVPAKLRAAGYEPFIQTLRAALRHAGGLRIDHVMGLFRLWWVPRGEHPKHGWYVRYPADEMLGIVALESQRAGAVIVGEDLGTVEPGVRERLSAWRILSCRLLWFEPRPPAQYPPLSMAAVTTHDLPTIAGLWSRADIAAHQAIGLPQSEELERLRHHLGEMLGLAETAPVEEVIEKAYRELANAASILKVATLEDAQAVWERPNMPGTIAQWPNWSLALPQSLEEMEVAELPRRIAAALGGK
jgi:4-alpha-glucanotransferase